MKKLFPFFFLIGCTTTQTVTGPDLTPHKLITCPEIESCYAEALNVCGGKYKIVNTSTRGFGHQIGSDLLVKCEGTGVSSSIP